MRILGIDPGTAIVGYAIVDYENGKYIRLTMAVFLQIRMKICQSGWKKFMMGWKTL